NFVVIMMGLNDRQSIKDRQPARPPTPQAGVTPAQPAVPAQNNAQAAAPKPEAQPQQDDEQSPSDQPSVVDTQPNKTVGSYEFHSDKWAELYSKRIDDLIAAAKSKGATVLWVGLPPLRGTKSSTDVAYLNDLYRGRADKAGIIYVDIWDGFVDEGGRYTQS